MLTLTLFTTTYSMIQHKIQQDNVGVKLAVLLLGYW